MTVLFVVLKQGAVKLELTVCMVPMYRSSSDVFLNVSFSITTDTFFKQSVSPRMLLDSKCLPLY